MDARLAPIPRQEPGAIIGIGLRAGDVEIAAFQRVGQMDEDADFEGATVHMIARFGALTNEGLPSLRGEAEVDLDRQLVAACMPVGSNDVESIEQAPILGSGLRLELFQSLEQNGSFWRVGGPEERQLVVAETGEDGLVVRTQHLDPTLVGEDVADLPAEAAIRGRALGRGDHPTQHRNQRRLQLPVLLLEREQPVLGCLADPPHATQEHQSELVTSGRLGSLEQAKQQRVASSMTANATHIADLVVMGVEKRRPEKGMPGRLGKFRLHKRL